MASTVVRLAAAERVLGICILIICLETAVLTGVITTWLAS
jgi:hypothetical protein